MTMVEFGTLFHFIRNGMNVKQDKSGEGLPITRIETISDSVVDAARVGYAGLTEDQGRSWLLEPGDILLSHINSVEHIGKCAVYRGQPPELVHSMNLLCLRSDTTTVLPEFAKYLIRSGQFRSRLSNSIKKAVNQASVSIGDLKAIPVDLPALPEQRRIAEILDKADALRAKRRAALAQLDTLTQSIFLDMFGDPVTNPKGWPQQDLATFFHFRTGKLDSNAAVPGGQFPFFTCSKEDFQIDTYAFDCEALLLAGNNASADYSVKHYKGKFNAYQRTYVITLRDDRNSYEFARQILEQHLAELKQRSKGTNTKYLTLELLNRVRIPVPPPSLQVKYAQHISAVKALKSVHSSSLTILDNLFDSLQHRAFRGEL
jgi:type I restriction enzyme, S subunit